VLDALVIPRAVIVGHSMGSAAALAFASEHPSRVAGLLLVDPVDDPLKRPPDPDLERSLARLEGTEYPQVIESYWQQILANATAEVRASVIADLKATPQRTVVDSMRALALFDTSRALARYRGPVMSVTTPLNDHPSSLHRLDPSLAHNRMTGVSHWLQLDRPEAFNRILDGFLGTIR
jgi:pimeloyl-ACP methyl ester carboxylesterase